MAKGDKLASLDAIGIDAIALQIIEGMSMTAIAAAAGVSIGTLANWLADDPARSARAREARSRSARVWDEKAEIVIERAGDPFELSRAKELAHHYRWRAKAIAPVEYGDKVAIGGAADLPPVQSAVTLDPSEAYKALIASKDGGNG